MSAGKDRGEKGQLRGYKPGGDDPHDAQEIAASTWIVCGGNSRVIQQ